MSEYDTSIVRMIRNNNVPIGGKSMEGCDVYFMLDYFDLLYHQKLEGENKVYKKFWNINDNTGEERFNYKVAKKTLSLYTKSSNPSIFHIEGVNAQLSEIPFLGIVQINIVHHGYKEADPDIEEMLVGCEQEIEKCIEDNIKRKDVEFNFKIYRSSTSGDFCLVIKSAMIDLIFRTATLINNLIVKYHSEQFLFSTYTNVGIECVKNNKDDFLTLQEKTIEQNKNCVFAIRFTTTCNEFAKEIFQRIEREEKHVIEQVMTGLFGRYDFLLHMSMENFSQIYDTLCKSKIDGFISEDTYKTDENASLVEVIKTGIIQRKIEVINERALVPVNEDVFDLQTSYKDRETIRKNIEKYKDKEINNVRTEFDDKMTDFCKFESVFVEERRAFIDLERELKELIRTYVPQGIEHDSYVNWQILISDFQTLFANIADWKDKYDKLTCERERQYSRKCFLEDLRLLIDAINQFYKYIQNVNAQTWQAPLYEIQTQLDAEKLMIAYREFLYKYFSNYQNAMDVDGRIMHFPIVYPDITIDKACVMVPFTNHEKNTPRLLVCRVPSFEYYGRMFDMIPWILHEASHNIRTMKRNDRNRYLIKSVFLGVFTQVMYKLLNQYSNDFGYYRLGTFENVIVGIMADAAIKKFEERCKEKNLKISQMSINYLESEMSEFLSLIFDRNTVVLERRETDENSKKIQLALLRMIGEMGNLEKKVCINKQTFQNIYEAVDVCLYNADVFLTILEYIYDSYYREMTGEEPQDSAWRMVLENSTFFEEKLEKQMVLLKGSGINDEWRMHYSYRMRELNRLAAAFPIKREKEKGEVLRRDIGKYCVPKIRMEIQRGFSEGKGFVELYRILNMIFGYGENIDEEECTRIGNCFNVLLQQEADDLLIREITIYRETYADLYLAATLGLSAFGYCRQMFQTVSDASVEEKSVRSNDINIQRFRSVIAVLLKTENYKNDKAGGGRKGNKYCFSAESLLKSGQQYCSNLLSFAERRVSKDVNKQDEEAKILEDIFALMQNNLCVIYECFQTGDDVEAALADSIITLCLDVDTKHYEVEDELTKAWESIREKIVIVQEKIEKCRHIIYRVVCFTLLLNLVIEEGNIIIEERELRHLKKLYTKQISETEAIRNEKVCKVVSGFYNDLETVNSKSYGEMLDDTLSFIQTYYYKNRFEIMHFINERKRAEDETEYNT